MTAQSHTTTLQGIAACAGWAIAKAHVLSSHALHVAHHRIDTKDVAAEQSKLRAAFAAAHAELNRLEQDVPHKELHALLEVHRLMLGDPVLYDAALDYIAVQQVNAAWALSEQVQQLVASFEAMDDAYLSERALDVRQVGQRVLGFLAGGASPAVAQFVNASGKPIILVAQDLAPADFAQWQHVALAGLVTELGGQASHTAIMARAHGIPAVLGIAQAAQRINDGDLLALNGSTGQLWINPDADLMRGLLAQQTAWQSQHAFAQAQVTQPAVTACGQAVSVFANIEHMDDMPHVHAAGLDGVGLFRSEFLFMGRESLPTEDEQYAVYSAVVRALNGKPATIRTLDVGADKLLNEQKAAAHAQQTAASPNPALGLRAVRYCLAHPALFVTQLKALLRAAAHGPVNVLIPMVSSADEVQQCRHWLNTAVNELKASNTPQGAVKVGVMIEIPAAAIAINTLLPHIDFCSVGTNDLIQYTLAIDRTDAAVAALYNPAHPAITALLRQVFTACAAAGKPVTVCGEMAGDTAHTHALLDMGLRQFSLNPSQAAGVKAAVRTWIQASA